MKYLLDNSFEATWYLSELFWNGMNDENEILRKREK